MTKFRFWLSVQIWSLWLLVTPKCDAKAAIVRGVVSYAEDYLAKEDDA